jgi:hypothetical protein
MFEHLRKVPTIDLAFAGWTADEMLSLVLGWIADAPADVIAARDVHHCCAVAGVGNTVSWPV